MVYGKREYIPHAHVSVHSPHSPAAVALRIRSQLDADTLPSAYTVPVQVGLNGPSFPLQVDTGSSDLVRCPPHPRVIQCINQRRQWVASTACSTDSCQATGGHLYNPSAAQSTNAQFTIKYLDGSASGPIVTDAVSIGGYNIANQALCQYRSCRVVRVLTSLCLSPGHVRH
jgi:hypothetical protein